MRDATFDSFTRDILCRFVAELNDRVSDSRFLLVKAFPSDIAGLGDDRVGLLRLDFTDRFFQQERLLNCILRMYVRDVPGDLFSFFDFSDEVKRHLTDITYIPGRHAGLEIGRINYPGELIDGYRFADISLKLLRVEDEPFVIEGVDIEQTFLTQSTEDATLTADGSFTLSQANFDDRDPATDGLTGTADTTDRNLDIEFSDQVVLDYFFLGNFTADSTGTLKFYFHDGTSYVELFRRDFESGSVDIFVETRQVTASQFRISIVAGSSAVFSIGTLFLGDNLGPEKSYDTIDSTIEVSQLQVTAGIDEAKGFQFATQSTGDRKYFWDVTWGLRKNELEDMVDGLLFAQFNTKPFYFADTYRDAALTFRRVQLQDAAVRYNQYFQDYFRLNLRIAEL